MRPFRDLHVGSMNVEGPTAPAVDPPFLEEYPSRAPDAGGTGGNER